MHYNPTDGFVTPDVVYPSVSALYGDAIPSDTVKATVLERNAPPSSYAVAAVLDGEEGAFYRLLGLTVLRATFIFPGLWLGSKLVARDLKTWQTAVLSLTTSVGITTGMLLWYKIQKDWNKQHPVTSQSFDGSLSGW